LVIYFIILSVLYLILYHISEVFAIPQYREDASATEGFGPRTRQSKARSSEAYWKYGEETLNCDNAVIDSKHLLGKKLSRERAKAP